MINISMLATWQSEKNYKAILCPINGYDITVRHHVGSQTQ